MGPKAVVLQRADWAVHDDLWRGRFEGKDFGMAVTVLFFTSEIIGEGPSLHVHPYDEVFIIRQGRAQFTIGDKRVKAEAGQILFGPANIPHKFTNLGPGYLETTDIHLNDRFIQTDLDDPDKN